MRAVAKILLNISFFFFIAPLGYAVINPPHLAELELQLEKKAQTFITKIDEHAIVSLKLVPKTTNVTLPHTNLVVKDMNVRTSDNSIEIKTVYLTVFSNNFELDDSMKRTLADLLGFKAGMVKFNTQKIPGQKQNNESTSREATETILQTYGSTIALLLLSFIFLATVGIFLVIKSINKLRSSLTEASIAISQKLESSQQIIDTPASNIKAVNDPNVAMLPQGESSSNYAGYSKESFLSIITDCYWSQYDEYGAYIWKKMPITVKQEILKEVSFLQSYTAYLATKSPADLGLEQHPSYLDPLPFHFLDNSAVTKIILDNPVIFTRVSPLRLEKLDIPANVLIELDNNSSDGDIPLDKVLKIISAAPTSDPRNLKASQEIRLRSIEDEQDLLDRSPFDLDLARRVRSLGWLVRLPDEKVIEILDSFSAKQLASAWIGPEAVLKQLEDRLSEGKRDNLKSYCESTQPSRDSVVFDKLFQRSLQELSNNLSNTQDAEEHHNDAA